MHNVLHAQGKVELLLKTTILRVQIFNALFIGTGYIVAQFALKVQNDFNQQ